MFPFIPLIISSFSPAWRFGEIIPSTFSLSAYEYVLNSNFTSLSIKNNIIISYSVALINLALGIPASYFLARTESRLKKIYMIILFAPLIIPPLSSVLGIHFNMIIYGLSGNLLGIILVNIIPSFPYVLLVLLMAFRNFPSSLEEAALIDGISKYSIYRYIFLPLLIPNIIVASTISILISLSEYILTFLIGGSRVMTLSIIMLPFISGGDKNIGAAYSILFIIVNILALLFFELFIVFFIKQYSKVKI